AQQLWLDDQEDLFVAAAVFFCFFVSSSIYLFTRAKSSYAVTSIASRCIPSPVSLLPTIGPSLSSAARGR
ncbi:MAG: hypothetical protein ORN25_02895, partial [Caulobacteraceae bacterium]|nr:hypothetical protein [Caulobacteraceae bacterium]